MQAPFQIDQTVIATDLGGCIGLTKGKTYKVVECFPDPNNYIVKVVNDFGMRASYMAYRFNALFPLRNTSPYKVGDTILVKLHNSYIEYKVEQIADNGDAIKVGSFWINVGKEGAYKFVQVIKTA